MIATSSVRMMTHEPAGPKRSDDHECDHAQQVMKRHEHRVDVERDGEYRHFTNAAWGQRQERHIAPYPHGLVDEFGKNCQHDEGQQRRNA